MEIKMFLIRRYNHLIISLLLILLTLIPISGDCVQNYLVKVIYLQPQGVRNVDHNKYNEIINQIREFFRDEMIRHNFGDKTFNFEKDNNGNLKTHSIKLPNQPEHYTGEIFTSFWNKTTDHLPFQINMKRNADAQKHVYIVVFAGVPVIGDGRGSPIGSGFTWQGNSIGGVSIVNENCVQDPLYHNRYESLISHELGHAFSLNHNFEYNTVMKGLPLGGPNKILDFEARLLNIHPLFTDIYIANKPPEIIDDLQLESIGRETIRFKIHVKGSNELYHLQLQRGMNCIGSAELNGKDDWAEIDVPRSNLVDFRGIQVRVYDINGNRSYREFPEPIFPEPLIEYDKTYKYLTINAVAINTLIPKKIVVNEWPGIFEKPPNGNTSNLPNWIKDHKILDEWNSWFYTHAPSSFIYDFSDFEYEIFESYLYFPALCEISASIEIICFADGEKIYQSGVLKPATDQEKHILVHFPKETNLFKIQVTIGGDIPHCDHYVLGEAKVMISENVDVDIPDNIGKDENIDEIVCIDCDNIDEQDRVIDQNIDNPKSVNPMKKLTIKWADLKLIQK